MRRLFTRSASAGVARAEHRDEGQRPLPLAEVGADRLAEAILIGDEVERVVRDLERDADVQPVLREGVDLLRPGSRPAAPPMRQHAEMNDAVFWVMIRR